MRMNISVPDALAAKVRHHQLPISSICQRALRAELNRLEAAEREAMEQITVEVGDGHRMWAEGFTGRWLATDSAGEWEQGIALTKGGRFAWFESVPRAAQGELLVYPTLRDLETAVQEKNWSAGEDSSEHDLQGLAGFRAMVVAAAEELGQEHVIWRDI